MSDVTPELPPPVLRRTWREQLAMMAEGLGLGPGRLVAGAASVVLVALVGWRLLAPAAEPPEMRIPFAERAAASAGGDGSSAGGGIDGGPGTAGAPGPVAPGTGAAAGGTGAAGPDGTDGLTPARPPAEVVVHVAGAVAVPGVQRLPAGARVVDAVDAAGGAAADADLARLNLAAPLTDGQQVYVLRAGEEPPGLPAPAGAPGAGATGDGAGPAALVDVNIATAEQLETLPGVGPATAGAIITHREQNGPFTSIEQLIEVRGIGEVKLGQLRDLVTVSG
jgi:competence protein ComEA